MSRWILPAVLIGLLAVVVLVPDGPEIDPSRVVTLEGMAPPITMTCLIYRTPDHRGWPIHRDERAYIRFMQDKGVRFVFIPDDDTRDYFALINIIDSLRIRNLYDEAKDAGVKVPNAPLTGKFER